MAAPETPSAARVDGPKPAAATDLRWVSLQRGVAVGMVLTFVAVLLLAPERLDVPLVPAALFTVALALTWWRPRGAAIAIGELATLWLVTQLVTIRALLPDLARPQDAALFATTLAMLTIPTAGVVGLVGMLRRSAGHIATIVLKGTGLVLLAGALLGVAAGAAGVGDPRP